MPGVSKQIPQVNLSSQSFDKYEARLLVDKVFVNKHDLKWNLNLSESLAKRKRRDDPG